MSAGWIAGAVRSRCMARRGLGTDGARALAASESVASAVETLARSPYGRWVHPGDDAVAAARGLAESVLWNMRVLAGWLPSGGADLLRALAGWFEISNVEGQLLASTTEPPFRLGALATAWPRLAQASSPVELREALAASRWGDPGGATPRDIQLGLRTSWAERVAVRIPVARVWAMGAVVLLVARERLARREQLPPVAAASAARIIGPDCSRATTLDELRAAVPSRARWALADVSDVDDLWRAEGAWWRRLRADSTRLVGGSGFGPAQAVGAVGLLAADAWRVRSALEAASRGREGLEVFDGLA